MTDNANSRVIAQYFGGLRALAKITGVTVSYVYLWGQPKEKRGHEGYIPIRYQRILLDYAKTNSIDLCPNDFFDPKRLEDIMKNNTEKYPPIAVGRKKGN